MGAELPFDEVKIDNQVVSVDEFLALPLFKRVRWVLAGDLEFLLHGEAVAQTDALRALRQHSS
jgi:hypothetical protein